MEIDPRLEAEAFREARERFPSMNEFRAKLVWRALFQGGAFLLEYEGERPPREHPDAWEFQNAVVKAYRRLAGA